MNVTLPSFMQRSRTGARLIAGAIRIMIASVVASSLPACEITEGPGPQPSPADVGPEGGVVETKGASITIPEGALSSTVRIAISESADAPPGGFTAYSPLFTFDPADTVLAQPATVELTATIEAANP